MKKILYFIMTLLVFVSCAPKSDNVPIEKKVDTSKSLRNKELRQGITELANKKMPLIIQEYNRDCNNIISIVVVSLVITSEGYDNCQGLFYTTWKIKKNSYFSTLSFDHFDDDFDCDIMPYIIEVPRISEHKDGYVVWETRWPDKNPFCDD